MPLLSVRVMISQQIIISGLWGCAPEPRVIRTKKPIIVKPPPSALICVSSLLLKMHHGTGIWENLILTMTDGIFKKEKLSMASKKYSAGS